MEKKTPLYDIHVRCGGKLVPFAGFLLPIQYTEGIIKEHLAVRQSAGLFDVSHMGEFFMEGPHALEMLQKLVTNDLSAMRDGQVKYSPMCNENGGVVDDILVYRLNEHRYMLVVNAANMAKDKDWITAAVSTEGFADRSAEYAQIAVQGPNAEALLRRLSPLESIPGQYYTFIEHGTVAGKRVLISRTGYTGEDGFEMYTQPEDAVYIWEALTNADAGFPVTCCGLGARDTLRLEAGMPLYGHELREDITPLEAGLKFFVKMKKPHFIGKEALQKRGEPTVVRTGLQLLGKGIARDGDRVFADGQAMGYVTSGTFLPSVQYAGAMAMIDKNYAKPGTEVTVTVRGRAIPAVVVKLPFYKRVS